MKTGEAHVASILLDLGAKLDVTTNLGSTSCGLNGDRDCSLITARAFANIGFSPLFTVGCDKVSIGGAFRGVAATAQLRAFEGSWFEVKVDKSIQLVQPRSFNTRVIELPAD